MQLIFFSIREAQEFKTKNEQKRIKLYRKSNSIYAQCFSKDIKITFVGGYKPYENSPVLDLKNGEVERIILPNGVREYSERYNVEVVVAKPNDYNKLEEDRVSIVAFNEARYNCTQIDLLDLYKWIKCNEDAIVSLLKLDD